MFDALAEPCMPSAGRAGTKGVGDQPRTSQGLPLRTTTSEGRADPSLEAASTTQMSRESHLKESEKDQGT